MEMFLSDSDSESSSQSSCSDYLDDIESIYGGQAQSILSNLERSIGKIDDFLAFERGFIHGDIVCYEADASGQLGRVVDMDTVVDLETVRGEIVKEVDCKKLMKVCPFVVGDYVVHGPWLGRVSRVVDRLTILFDDGAKCEVTAIIPDDIRPICTSVLEDSQYPHYPGQHVQIRISSVLKSARWLCGEWKGNRTEGTVCRVEAGMVYVDWVASAMIHCAVNVPSPPCLQEPKDLALLSCFTHANWQLGDWCILLFDNKSIGEKQVLNVCGEHISEHFGRGLLQGNHKGNYETLYVIVKKRTKVNVLWQDGTHSVGLDSQCLLPVNSVGDHEFWPEQFVLEKSSDDQHFASIQRSGYVKSVDAKERTVRLKWTTHARNGANDSDENCNEETVSAYELVEHPDYSYCLGDIVFRLGKTLSVFQADGQTECEDLLTTETWSGSVKQFKEDYNTSKRACESSLKYENMCYLSCIGNVIGFKDEAVVVTWASGLTSKVAPWEIVGIDKYEHPVAVPVLYEEDTEDKMTQEMPEYDKQFSHRKDKDVLEYTGNSVDGGDHNKDTWETHGSLISQTAIGFFKKIAVSLFGLNGSTSLSNSMESSPLSNLDSNQPLLTTGVEIESLHDQVKVKCSNLTTVPLPAVDDVQTDIKRQVEEPQEQKEPYCSHVSDIPAQFKQFDTVDDLLDHHYAHGSGKESMLPQVKRGWLKKVQQEWSILERDLPDTIYVRVCEQRIDILRAAIVGAPGTPYQDGLFFFDFYLPGDYPNEPPIVHYRSGGLRLNPNLYESGKICLSLLNTWMGTGTEAWNPGSSTILQVLLSLQALVLNEKPYFNEAGYDTQVGRAEGEKNSITYNENVLLLSYRSMLYVLSKPPKHFEALVEEHFSRRSHSILLACKAYMDGAPVGYAIDSESYVQKTQKSSSTGFKLMIAKLFPKLVSGFTAKGIACNSFIESGNPCIENK